MLLAALLAGNRHDAQGQVLTAEGREVPVEIRASRVSYDDSDAVLLHVRDTTERQRTEEQLREHEQRFAALVEQVQDYAIYVTDPEGRATTWNLGVKRVLGFEEAEFIGQDIDEAIFTPEDIAAGVPQLELRQAARTGTAANDRWMRRNNGRRFWVAGMTTALRDNAGKLLGFMKVMRDQTEQKQLEEQLRETAGELAETNRRKDQFLATLAHELRNPLAPLRTGLELMKLSMDTPAALEQTREIMERQLHQLITLVDDLLDVSRISRGSLRLRKTRIAVSDVVQSAVEASKPVVDKEQHELIVQVPQEPIFLDADPHRLAQVLSNLLNNAAKYTEKGGHISLTVHRDEHDVLISVKDDGIGIPADMLDHIFEMFGQIDRADDRGSPGMGIGLTLVRSLVEMHGGSVHLHSAGAGRGAEFTVRLPVTMEQSAASTDDVAEEAPADASPLRILVVDDNQPAADLVGQLIRMLGHEVRTVYDGQEAVDAARQFSPHVVVMDLGMPRMNGYEAARHIREQSWGQQMVLIALTGWGQDDDKRRTKAAGFDHHVTKPLEPAELRRLFSKLPSRHC